MESTVHTADAESGLQVSVLVVAPTVCVVGKVFHLLCVAFLLRSHGRIHFDLKIGKCQI